MTNDCDTESRLAALRSGDMTVLPELFQAYRPKLRQMVRFRLGPQLAARVDPSDVLQDGYIEAQQRIDEYLRQPKVSFFIWIRGMVWNRLQKLQRAHIGTQRRSVSREERINLPEGSSVAVAMALTTPSEKMAKAELHNSIQKAINDLSESDRDVILMRYFEGLTNLEIAQALSLTPAGATMRHGRALSRLRASLERHLQPP